MVDFTQTIIWETWADINRSGTYASNHKQFVDQTPEVAIEWAESIGSSTLSTVKCLLNSYQSEKQALQSIFSLKNLEHRYSKYEIERACKTLL